MRVLTSRSIDRFWQPMHQLKAENIFFPMTNKSLCMAQAFLPLLSKIEEVNWLVKDRQPEDDNLLKMSLQDINKNELL